MAVRNARNFNFPDADIVFQSSDAIRFHIHARNLAVSSGGFPPVPPRSNNGEAVSSALALALDEIVPLPEPANVLEILFAFTYPKRHPDLEEMAFERVHAIAEAAEKYEVFPAMNLCKNRIRSFIPTNPIEACLFGARHDYIDIVKDTAKYAISLPLSKVVPLLPPQLILPWIEYKEEWQKIGDWFLSFQHDSRHRVVYANPSQSCSDITYQWSQAASQIIQKVRTTDGPNPFMDLEALFNHGAPSRADKHCLSPGSCCVTAWNEWKKETRIAVGKLPPFSDFILRHTRL